ncbi:serine hydrolase [Limnovirga soli]|uniref:Serine hydrolase n=1 Tax=Limnovirga soli TaxID=2656915 RepID=A0A8J8JUL6_9BACT|nr:serine hydrolase [Limnovirga soli]NNV55699.1 serine hydrolase [Limnovirga soli]
MKKLLIIFCIIGCAQVFAQTPKFISKQLDAYIEKGMKDWQIPGLAIAIVKDGQVVLMKGYGVSDMSTNAPVDENTLFMIASNSKLFTATALSQLEYDKKLSLDDKITKYFPDYTVNNPTTTSLVTIRDMLSHHLGTGTFQGDFTFWNSALSRKQIMDKMKLLVPAGKFRQTYGYCNSCFLTAGEIIPKVTDMPWEVYVYDSIVAPVGMTNTNTLSYGVSMQQNVAKPYTNTFSSTLQPLPYDMVDNLAPAGSMVSCVKDLSKWLLVQLDSGRADGKQIIPWPVISKTREMNTIVSSQKSRSRPTHFVGYGLGVFMCDYYNRQVYWHTGGADGFVTNTCFVPEEKLGITILTNNDNQSFFESLRYQILDAYLGVPFVNRSETILPGFLKEHEATVKEVEAFAARVKNMAPPLPLQAYAGTYNNELYGNIDISLNGNDLSVDFLGHKNLTATLQYMDNGEWLLTYNNPAFGVFPLKFKTNGNKVVSTVIKVNDFIEYDPYIFTKQ